MECKCDNKDMLKIVRGNAFAIELKVEAKRLDGTTVEDFDLATAEATLLVRHNDTSTEYEYLLASKNAVTVSFEDDLQLGWYGMEMSGYYDGLPWRWRVDDVFQIVETNAKANVPAWSVLTDSTYMMGVAMSLYQGSNVQADWNEKDERSAAYIKNKPNIYTKSEVDAAIATEGTRAKAAEQVNATAIANEVTRATEAEQTNATAIATEETRAKAAEQENATAIANEVTRATAAEQTNATAIATEGTRARLAEQENATAIANEVTRATAAEQTNATAIAAEETRAKAAEQENATAIGGIEEKIPTQATAQNQLADKNFVNSSISTATADFKGTYNSLADLQAVVGANANDYGFVVATDAAGNTVYKKYKYVTGTGWVFEYDLNNSSFTAEQWATIQSGMTAALTSKLADLPTNTALQEALTTIRGSVTTEEARARAAEQENATAIAAEETRAKAAEQENATAIGGKQDTIEDLAAIRSGAAAGATAVQPATLDGYYTKSEVDEILRSIAAVAEGYVRVAGSSSPALSYKHYKRDDGDFSAQSVFNIFYPCLVGTPLTGSGTEGKILHILDKLGAQNDNGVVKWADLKGVLHNIDGSEGDVIICNTEPYYRIMGKRTVNNVVYDVFLMSVQPFRWQGYESEKVEKCGMSPDYCVSHTDSDNVTRMHSVFNPLWEGTRNEVSGCVGKYVYSYDAETGEMVETYDADAALMGDAGGLHTTNHTLPEGEQAAMNNNPDTTKTVPCMNATAAMVENMFAVMLAEGGTFDAHNASLMGSGFCSNDLANTDNDFLASGFDAKNGMRIKDKNDEWQYYGLATSMSFLTGSSLHGYNMLNEYANPFRIMEAQRAICYAVKHGVHELEWFAFEGNKYKWRSVDGFLSPTQGEMTCVLWKMFETKAPDTAVDPTDTTTSIAGNRIQLLVSIALYHGVTTQVSPGWWTSGLVFTVDNQRTNKCYMQRDQSKLSVTPVGEKLVAEEWDFEQTYNHVVDVGYGNKYIMDYNNDALMLPESNDAFGGTLHTYVCQHKRFNSSRAPSGKKMVRGFVRGGGVGYSAYSPFLVNAYSSPSNASSLVGFGICYQIVD